MATTKDFEAKSLDEAIQAASRVLGVSEDDVHYRLIDEGRRGVLGLGARNVRIQVEVPSRPQSTGQPQPKAPPQKQTRNRPPSDAKANPAEPSSAAPPAKPASAPSSSRPAASKSRSRGRRRDRRPRGKSEQAPATRRENKSPAPETDAAQIPELEKTVQSMLGLMELELTVRVSDAQSGVRLEFEGPDRPLVFQQDNEFPFALQFLLNRMSRRTWPGIGRIQVAGDDHRSQKDDDLVEEVREVAGQVARTGEQKTLHPMNPYERRLVHLTVREYTGLATHSDGEGFLKAITVSRVETTE